MLQVQKEKRNKDLVKSYPDSCHLAECLGCFLVDRLDYCHMSLGDPHPNLNFTFPGIYFEPQCSSEDLDHGVLVVGYGVEGAHSNNKYWLVKNRYKNVQNISI